jgi:hypothetical protein
VTEVTVLSALLWIDYKPLYPAVGMKALTTQFEQLCTLLLSASQNVNGIVTHAHTGGLTDASHFASFALIARL